MKNAYQLAAEAREEGLKAYADSMKVLDSALETALKAELEAFASLEAEHEARVLRLTEFYEVAAKSTRELYAIPEPETSSKPVV